VYRNRQSQNGLNFLYSVPTTIKPDYNSKGQYLPISKNP
jgi:hypothetical protein